MASAWSPKLRKAHEFGQRGFFVGSTVLHYLTAWYALVDRARLQPGETVLITGARRQRLGASKSRGRVIAAVGSVAKAQAVRDGEAEHVIDTSCEDMRERVKALTKDRGLTSAWTILAERCF